MRRSVPADPAGQPRRWNHASKRLLRLRTDVHLVLHYRQDAARLLLLHARLPCRPMLRRKRAGHCCLPARVRLHHTCANDPPDKGAHAEDERAVGRADIGSAGPVG